MGEKFAWGEAQMKQVMILAEGQTEEAFVNKVLAPYFHKKNIYLNTTMICTRKVRGTRRFRGGLSSYNQVKRDIENLLKSTHFDLVTTFLDYYGLPFNFPGQDFQIETDDCYKKVAHLESSFSQDISHDKFKPFIMLHEFEAMIFCDIDSLSGFFPEKRMNLDRLRGVATQFVSPEEINNSPETAPSKRLLLELNGYDKTLHGPIATQEIGIDKIREMCPHLNDWLNYIESL